jgi:pimeloyl-ACP methyl ester carboxylesterase
MPAFFENRDARLAFTVDFPHGRPPFPAVVLGHGSGRTTRDQLTFLSARLTGFGFAVLRFDKRGAGESTGTYLNVGVIDSPDRFPLLASDVAAGVRFLRTRPEIDPRRIGLAGVSQAGWILPHAARELGDVAFVLLLSGPVCSVGQEVFYSNIVERDASRTIAEAQAAMSGFTGPPGYDPLPVLRTLDTPTLWVLGLDDRSIPIELTLGNLQALKAAGRPVEWRTYPGLGHSLGPQIWDDIGSWIAGFR